MECQGDSALEADGYNDASDAITLDRLNVRGVGCAAMDPLLSKAAADATLEDNSPSRPLTADEITTVLDLRRTITFLRHQLSLILGSESVDDRLPLTCYRCGHRWRTVYEGRIPKACPRCHSMAWNRVGGGRSKAMIRSRKRKTGLPKREESPTPLPMPTIQAGPAMSSPPPRPWTSFAPPPPTMGLPQPPTRNLFAGVHTAIVEEAIREDIREMKEDEGEQLDSQVPPR